MPQPPPSRRRWHLLMKQASHLPGVVGSGEVRAPLPSTHRGRQALDRKASAGPERCPGCVLRRGCPPPTREARQGRGQWQRGRSSEVGRPPAQMSGGLQEVRGGGLAQQQVALGVAASGGTPCLLVGAVLETLGWESRPDSGARAQVVPKGCSINGGAGQASRRARRDRGLWPPPTLRAREERGARGGISGAVRAGVVHSCRVPGWTERWGWSEPWSAPLGWGRAEPLPWGLQGSSGPA